MKSLDFNSRRRQFIAVDAQPQLVSSPGKNHNRAQSSIVYTKQIFKVVYMLNNSILHIKKSPYAFAKISGSDAYPDINGGAYFYTVQAGILVAIQIKGLPESDDICKKPIFAVHIHNGDRCTGNRTDPFADAMTHYNPYNCAHPYHAGDFPPIFGADGLGFSAFLTNRFSAEEITGRTIIIHAGPDDFTTQPSGNSGMKIGCGVISPVY